MNRLIRLLENALIFGFFLALGLIVTVIAVVMFYPHESRGQAIPANGCCECAAALCTDFHASLGAPCTAPCTIVNNADCADLVSLGAACITFTPTPTRTPTPAVCCICTSGGESYCFDNQGANDCDPQCSMLCGACLAHVVTGGGADCSNQCNGQVAAATPVTPAPTYTPLPSGWCCDQNGLGCDLAPAGCYPPNTPIEGADCNNGDFCETFTPTPTTAVAMTPTPTPSASPTATATPTPSATATTTPTPTITPTPTVSPTATRTPTVTPTPTCNPNGQLACHLSCPTPPCCGTPVQGYTLGHKTGPVDIVGATTAAVQCEVVTPNSTYVVEAPTLTTSGAVEYDTWCDQHRLCITAPCPAASCNVTGWVRADAGRLP